MAEPFAAPVVEVYAGDTLAFPLYEIRSGTTLGSEETTGTPVDYSAYTFTAQWRKSPNASESIALTVDASQANIGIFDISATPAQTRAMGTSGVWDLQGTLNGDVETLIVGATLYRGDVTRA